MSFVESQEGGLEEMEKILQRAEVGRLALCDGRVPYIVPLNFSYQQGKIAFHCAWEGRKLDLLKTNPHCCIEVDEFRGEVSDHNEARCHLDYDSVLAFGKGRIEHDEGEKVRLLQLFAEKYSELYRKPLSDGGKRFGSDRVAECCLVVIELDELTGRRERTVEGKRKKTMWHHTF
jgi:nitroimidazol reductase NimA-like FMN-containing flavoprotein (pyridoxamine 5'-phosphate oxidase superfamily)